MVHITNVGSMLGQHWPKISSTMVQCWSSLSNVGSTTQKQQNISTIFILHPES